MVHIPHFSILTINTEWRETEFSRLCDVTELVEKIVCNFVFNKNLYA